MRRSIGLAAALIAVASLAAPGPASAASPDWVRNPATGHFYAQTDAMTWADAEAYAVRLGGHLVTVSSAAEEDWLTATFPDPWLWIGMNDVARNGHWVWASHERAAYTNWAPGEPDNWKGSDPLGEHASTLNNGDGPGWIDVSGRWLLSGIVEVPGRPINLSRDVPVTGTHDGTTDDPAYGEACVAEGWAWDPDSPNRDVTVRILATRLDITTVPVEVWRGPAGMFRDDLLTAGIGDGTAAFSVDLRPLIAWGLPYEILIQGRDFQTGLWTTLDGSPRALTCLQ